MNYVLDTHSHTVSSGHAYSTLKEMVQAAAGKGLEALALTEHAMAMPGACHEFHFSNYKVVPRQWEGLRLLCGVELNIMDFQGKVDMPERLLKKMDLVIASMHIPCLKRGSREENTAAALGVLENPYVDILGHPDDNRYPLDYRITGSFWLTAGNTGCLWRWAATPTSSLMWDATTMPTSSCSRSISRRSWC